jgi:hypothetical protein
MATIRLQFSAQFTEVSHEFLNYDADNLGIFHVLTYNLITILISSVLPKHPACPVLLTLLLIAPITAGLNESRNCEASRYGIILLRVRLLNTFHVEIFSLALFYSLR